MPERGRVKWFSSEKGYGFIELDGRGDVFAHYTDIVAEDEKFRLLNRGVLVEFDLVEGKTGLRATSIVVVEEAVKDRGESGEETPTRDSSELTDDG